MLLISYSTVDVKFKILSGNNLSLSVIISDFSELFKIYLTKKDDPISRVSGLLFFIIYLNVWFVDASQVSVGNWTELIAISLAITNKESEAIPHPAESTILTTYFAERFVGIVKDSEVELSLHKIEVNGFQGYGFVAVIICPWEFFDFIVSY